MGNNNTLQYNVMRTPDGYIATCGFNPKISIFSKEESQLDDVIHAAAKLYAREHPDDPHVILNDGNTRMERRDSI